MAEFIKLHVSVTLKHILDRGPTWRGDNGDSDSEDDDEETNNGELTAKGGSRKRLVTREGSPAAVTHQLLDLDGPKLIEGVRNWLVFYKLWGQFNFTGRPLYVSIIFKLLVLAVTSYVVITRFVIKFFSLHVIDESFKNPIFLFISCSACVCWVVQILLTVYENLFNLCPVYKVLITPKLCFINTETQHILGTKSLTIIILVHLYNTFIFSMATNRNWTEFVNQFDLLTFMLEFYSIMVFTYYLIGLTLMDLYIRCAFGCWLLALKSHLERQFTYLHRYQRRSARLGNLLGGSNFGESLSGGSGSPSRLNNNNNKTPVPPIRIITLDEIQKNLNHMDDHLEVLRSIQISTLVLTTLNAFLGNGAVFLLAYHLMADQSNYYHGFLFLLMSINYIIAVFLSYAGDRWLFYALESFVQTVEDEYFMQSDTKALEARQARTERADSSGEGGDGIERLDEPQVVSHDSNHILQQILLIKKKDVLFCREFLHQFENHLATPWSKLTLKSHLHLMRAFVTLIAAQIIFDHEH